MKKCTACGVEPFDKSFGVGYQVGHGDYSPYPRVNRARKSFLEQDFIFDAERACLLTEGYKANAAAPQVLKVAHAIEHVLQNVKIDIYPDELIVGEIASPNKTAPIFPEFSYDWIMDEMENDPFDERPFDQYGITDETKEKLKGIAEFWKGQTVAEAIENNLSPDEKKGSEMGRGMYILNLYHYGGIGHLVADYPKLLKVGFGGIRAEVEEKLASLNTTTAEGLNKRNFYQAQLIMADAASTYIERYAFLAEELAAIEKDDERKQQLLLIASNCHQVARGPARDIWEAVQLWYLATCIILIESNGHSISYGRMDQFLYPYYKKDLETGKFTKDFIQELIEITWIKASNPCKLRDKMTMISNTGRGYGGESLTIGGVDRNGMDATNDLTFMFLDASAHTRVGVPWLCVRMHANTPYELKVKIAEVIRAGFGHPKIYNDEAAIPAILSKGRSLEEARDYAVVGCVELDTPYYEYGWHDSAYMNIAKVLELAITGGRCIACNDSCPRYEICGGVGKQLAPSTGTLADFTSFDQVLESFDKQMKYWTDQMVSGIEMMDICHQKLKPLPYLSLLMNDCIEKGVDVSAGGARYNHSGPQAVGIATVADSLCTIKQLIFDEKRTNGTELLNALENDWDDFDELYALVNSSKVHHFGNDDDYADDLAKFAFDCYCKHIERRPNSRGGTFTPGVYGVSANVGLGLIFGPSADGRKSMEPISDNLGPVHTEAASHDLFGPTGLANSVTKFNHSRATNGTLLNWKFNPECVSGDTGLANVMDLIDVYFEQKGMHSQFNILSTETMKDAMEHPENYKDMLVRVAGYSAYFVELSPFLQLDLIGRTELSFE